LIINENENLKNRRKARRKAGLAEKKAVTVFDVEENAIA
jgi:hypothetical protein